jgi:hypothetical protein
MKITRDVVVDLWPVYESGEASADTRALVDEFLKQEPDLARKLREDPSARVLAPVPLPLAPDHEMKAFKETRMAVHRIDWTLFLAMMFSGFAFGRIVSDTSWDVSPRNFAIVAGIAAIFWIAFITRLVRKLSALR